MRLVALEDRLHGATDAPGEDAVALARLDRDEDVHTARRERVLLEAIARPVVDDLEARAAPLQGLGLAVLRPPRDEDRAVPEDRLVVVRVVVDRDAGPALQDLVHVEGDPHASAPDPSPSPTPAPRPEAGA